MLRYTVNRVFTAAILMVMASVFAFLIVAAFPGNVAALIAELLGGFVSQDVVDKVAEEYRLNDPLIARYGYWVADVLNGNLGRSFRSGEEVTVELLERLRPTFTLLLGGSIVTLVVAVSLGFLGALWPGGFIDRAIRAIAVVNISIPKFFLAAMLIYVFGVVLNVLPTFGYRGPESWILPAIAIGVVPGALLSRVARVSLEDAMSRPYVTTALAKGLSRRRILFRDALPNIVPIVLTALGMDIAFMVQGALIIEPIFAWQGLGTYMVEAARFRDLPVMQASLLSFAALFILVNLTVDLVVMLVNPLQRRPGRG
jgi:peptide/nickel transport system permease protein